MKKFLTILFLLLSTIAWGQAVVTTTGVCSMREAGGEYYKACRIALERAKALAVADVCGEDVSVFSISKHSDERASFITKYNISSYGIVRVLNKEDYQKHNKVVVKITSEVYDASGPKYIDVTGTCGVYDISQNITCDIRFFNTSYLKIFWFDNLTGCGGILYDESRQFHTSPYPIRFPDVGTKTNFKKMICPWLMTPDEIMYEWRRTHVYHGTPKGTDEDKYVTLVFVATNSNVPYTPNTVNEECFLNWWCSLPCSERSELERKSIIIKL